MPDVSGVTVVTNACAFYHCTRGCGRAERPAFPGPSELRGRNEQAKPRAKSAARSRSCILPSLRGANGSRECAPDDRLRDEAIHSSLLLLYGLLR
jgi:hypothetical protein